jgi:two-component system chemotaxis sensor kinase CheA
VAAQAKTAIRYKPPADCFFSDEDPLAIIAALPELLSVDIEPVQPWPSLDGLNPFDCNLILKALTRQSAREVAIVLVNRMNQCEIEPLNALQPIEESTADAGVHASWPQARKLAEEQIALLAEAAEPAASAGRVASAGAVVANALRYLGRLGDADRLDRATAESLAAKDPDLLRRQIIAVFQQTSPTKAAPITTASQNHRQDSGAQTLRVDAARIDALVRLTGELTVAKNAIGHIARLAWTEENSLAPLLKSSHETFEQLVGELQRAALGMRILPLRHVFQRFSRLIREISSDLGKSARLVVEGEDTEADKAVVESLFEPLLHVLRNAMDHGVEDTAERAAARKPAVATVHLRAARQGEHVIVEVEDDGRGIDAAKIRQVARERSLMSDEKLGAMNDAEIADLIFAPGFSTAAQVTGLSGRGVGMDAVRTAVRHLGGQVTIDSAPGQGTTVRFILPYSVMVTQVMIVEAGSQLFGVPLDAVVETRRIPKGSIAPIGAGQAIVLDDQTIPLLELAEALGLHRADNRQEEATVVVVKLNGSIGALQVDRLAERMEIMLKPLDGLLAGMPGIAGSTLLGDGSVLLVLDLGELIQ